VNVAADFIMNVDDAVLAPGIGERCPRCQASDLAMTLLTSMTRYYVCERCQCRWQVLRQTASDEPRRESESS
jgi:transposase-like protein